VWRAGLLLVAALSAVARADGGDIDHQRDAFGFTKKKKQEPPLDCNDGTQFGCTAAQDPLSELASPFTLATWLPGTYLLSLPVADASHDAVAHYALGAGRDEAGPFFGGATGLENRWTLDGAPIDGMRTGGADTRIPLAFLDGMLVSAGGFTARDRASTGGTIDAQLRRGTPDHRAEVRGWFGISAPNRERPIPPLTYQVRRGHLDAGPEGTIHAVATGPLGSLLSGNAWYAVGIGAEVGSSKLTLRSQRLIDQNLDGVIDVRENGTVPTQQIDQYTERPVTYRAPIMLRAGLDRGRHHLDATLLGSAGSDFFYLYNSTQQAAGIDGRTINLDGIVTWRGKWTNTRARAQLAWHRTMRDESASDPAAANRPQLLSAYIPTTLADDPILAAACDDTATTDPFPLTVNCAVPTGWFASGGAGALVDSVGDRPSLTLDIAHRIGANVVRAGLTGEDTRLVTETELTGGYQARSLFPEHRAERRFIDPDEICNATLPLPCPTVNTSVLRYRTRYTAAYLEDTWQATKSISVNAGMRWELMWVGPVLHFSDQLAPRLGFSWDPVGGGRSRVWASMGRSFAMLPAGLGRTILERDRTVDHIVSSFGEGRSVDVGAVSTVAAGIEPIAQDELTTGAQIALARTVRATVWMQGRFLRRGIDTTTSGFDNPGRLGGTPAIRNTGLLAAEVATAPTGKLVLRAGYMYGRTIGSWTGAFDPRQGAVLYAGDDYDTTSANLLGRLPTDMGHRTYIEAQRSGSLVALPVWVSLRLTAGSGRPRSVLADSEDGIIYLIPRGSAGRGPVLTQSNVRMGARVLGFDVTLDLLNVFNRREATSIDEVYTTGAVRPIDRGSAEDLVWLKNDNGLETSRRVSYARAVAYQNPFSAVLGIRQEF